MLPDSPPLSASVGAPVGMLKAVPDGAAVGTALGSADVTSVGAWLGAADGSTVASATGDADGDSVGDIDGTIDGAPDGDADGDDVGADGPPVGVADGTALLGTPVGAADTSSWPTSSLPLPSPVVVLLPTSDACTTLQHELSSTVRQYSMMTIAHATDVALPMHSES